MVPNFWFRFCAGYIPFLLPDLFSALFHSALEGWPIWSHQQDSCILRLLVWFGQWGAPVETGENKNVMLLIPLAPSQSPLKLPVFLMGPCSFQHLLLHRNIIQNSLLPFNQVLFQVPGASPSPFQVPVLYLMVLLHPFHTFVSWPFEYNKTKNISPQIRLIKCLWPLFWGVTLTNTGIYTLLTLIICCGKIWQV